MASARASVARCFWPPDRLMPRSPSRVWYPLGNPVTVSWRWAATEALRTRRMISSVGLDGGIPNAMFRPRRAENRKLSWGAKPTRARMSAGSYSGSGAPSSRISPEAGSWMREMSETRVLFPDAVGPTMAMVWPGSAVKVMSCRTRRSVPG